MISTAKALQPLTLKTVYDLLRQVDLDTFRAPHIDGTTGDPYGFTLSFRRSSHAREFAEVAQAAGFRVIDRGHAVQDHNHHVIVIASKEIK